MNTHTYLKECKIDLLNNQLGHQILNIMECRHKNVSQIRALSRLKSSQSVNLAVHAFTLPVKYKKAKQVPVRKHEKRIFTFYTKEKVLNVMLHDDDDDDMTVNGVL